MNIIEVNQLTKTYHKNNGEAFDAVKAINFTVKSGEIFSFLGPNGAGKSTTIGMLTAQILPTSGSIKIFQKALDANVTELKSKIGVVTQHNNLDRGLTARENLLYHAHYFGMHGEAVKQRVDFLLEKFGLKAWENEFVKHFSGGMIQRLKIARAIVHKPELLFLDEPTTGLDPQYREILWEQVLDLKQEGTTIFLTTHYMEEPERFSDRIAIYAKGEIKAIGTAQELRKLIPGHLIARLTGANIEANQVKVLQDLSFVEKVDFTDQAIVFYLKDGDQSKTDFVTWLINSQIRYDNLTISSATLDDIFIQLTSEQEENGGDV
ncbi:ABC transporter [Lactococcus piscium]|uniref:ABC transporter n=1 Tax=Pseudolactococcus piscium TaxID=1364 RepID=A0A2A5S636_9LACT|nr:ABC transporter ATP-binding protein [Lactococcus piscium]PCS08910.1 ABC transporter [Lactococcus piscium]